MEERRLNSADACIFALVGFGWLYLATNAMIDGYFFWPLLSIGLLPGFLALTFYLITGKLSDDVANIAGIRIKDSFKRAGKAFLEGESMLWPWAIGIASAVLWPVTVVTVVSFCLYSAFKANEAESESEGKSTAQSILPTRPNHEEEMNEKRYHFAMDLQNRITHHES